MTKILTIEGKEGPSILLDEVLKQEQLLASARERTFNKGDIVWRQGDESVDVPFILKGSAFVSTSAKNDPEQCFSFIWANDLQGYLQNLFFARWESQAIVASSTATICFISRSRFIARLNHDIVLQNLVIQSFSDYCQFISANFIELSSLLLEDRVSRFLAGLAKRCGRTFTKHEMEIPIFLTRSQVACILRTRVETIIRVLALWRKKKWIRDTKDGIAVCGELHMRIQSLIESDTTRAGHKL